MPARLCFHAQDLAARLPPLLVAASRVAAATAQGAHGRRRAGPGEVFWQFRQSQPGDSLTAIDWRQSARTEHLYVREREWAAAQTVWLWRDGSASMDWRSGPGLPTKRRRAELLILALAALLLKGGERVALLSGGFPPATGRGVLERLAAALDKGEGGGEAQPTDRRHAPVVLVGDFLDPLERTAERLRAMGGCGHLLQILDPAEETLPYDGRVRFEGPEGEGRLEVRRAEDLRAGYRLRLADHRAGLAALAANAGWSFATHRTDQPPGRALLALAARLAEAAP